MKEIFISNQKKAEELMALGFNCKRMIIGGQIAFCFHNIPELVQYLQNHFNAQEYIISSQISF